MLGQIILPCLSLASLASASTQRLLVSSYKPQDTNATVGAIQTLELKTSSGYGSASTLKLTHTSHDCERDPTWLDTSLGNGVVLCLDEAIDEGYSGHLTKLSIKSDGSLEKLSSIDVLRGPVNLATYSNKSALALANYEPPSISTFKVGPNNTFPALQNFTFPVPDAQNGTTPVESHIHEAVLDPTGKYLIFPDLGADLVRVYCIDTNSGLLTEDSPLKLKTGEGPRHATFWTPTTHSHKTFLFVIHELTSKISSYKVKYLPSGGLAFHQIDTVSTFGPRAAPQGAAAAELTLSPDNNFLVASNRNATMFQLPNPDPSNSTTIPSDSIVTFKPSRRGKLAFVQLAPSGGSFPRHFKMNGEGSLIAVANQNSGNVNVYERNVRTGVIGGLVAGAEGLGPGGLTNVQWI